MKTSRLYQLADLARRLGYDFHSPENEAVLRMRQAIAQLAGRAIQINVETAPNGTWFAQSTNVDGLITGGSDQSEMDAMIRDAIFTYYGIPPQHALDSLIVNLSDRKSRTKQESYATA